MNRREASVFVLAAWLVGGLADGVAAEGMPENTDGLVRQRSKRLKYVYLLPGAPTSAVTTRSCWTPRRSPSRARPMTRTSPRLPLEPARPPPRFSPRPSRQAAMRSRLRRAKACSE